MAGQMAEWFLKKAAAMTCKTEKGTELVDVKCRLTDTKLELSHNGRGFRMGELLDLLYDIRTVLQASRFQGSSITISSYLKKGDLYKKVSIHAGILETDMAEGVFAFLERIKQEVQEALTEEIPEETFDRSAFHTAIRIELESEACYKHAEAQCQDLREQMPFLLLNMPQLRLVELVWDTFARRESMVCRRGAVKERKNGLKEMEVFQGEICRTLLYETVGEGENRIVAACELEDNRIRPMQGAMFGEIPFPVMIEWPL